MNQHIALAFIEQIRAQEKPGPFCWIQDFWEKFDPVFVEHKNVIAMVIDAFEDGPYSKIILSLN